MVAFGGDPCHESIEGCSDGRRAGWIVYVGGIEAKSCREERDSDVWLVGVQHSGRNGPQQRSDMWTGHASVLLGNMFGALGYMFNYFARGLVFVVLEYSLKQQNILGRWILES